MGFINNAYTPKPLNAPITDRTPRELWTTTVLIAMYLNFFSLKRRAFGTMFITEKNTLIIRRRQMFSRM